MNVKSQYMDHVYYNWLWLIAGGAFIGLFVRVPALIRLAGICWGVAIAGMVISAGTGDGKTSMYFGVAVMGIPMVGGAIGFGALLTSLGREAMSKRWKTIHDKTERR